MRRPGAVSQNTHFANANHPHLHSPSSLISVRAASSPALQGPRTADAMTTATTALRPLPLLSRIAAAVLGGYAFCWGFVALGLAGFYAAGMAFHDAEHLSSILGLLLYLVAFCWTFAVPRVGRAWALLVGGGALMAGIAALIQRAMV
jgi:hypothetical protein